MEGTEPTQTSEDGNAAVDSGASLFPTPLDLPQGDVGTKSILSEDPSKENRNLSEEDTSTKGKEGEIGGSTEVEGRGGVMSDVLLITSWPDVISLTPALTLGRDRTVNYNIPAGITPVYKGPIEEDDWRLEISGQTLRITPKRIGELSVPVFYNETKRTTFLLTVNPDPWSLWQVKDPEKGDLVFEEDSRRLDNHHETTIAEDFPDFHFQIAGASRRGRSHEHAGTFRDDDMGYWADANTGRFCLIVSDGAGSCKFSREGSRLAIQYIIEKLDANLTQDLWDADGFDQKPEGKVGMKLAGLTQHAYKQLSNFVSAENERHPDNLYTLKDFSATLLIAALKKDTDGGLRLVTFSIGDGAIAWYTGNGFGLMCSPDSGEFGGGTRFLTTPEVWSRLFGTHGGEEWTWPTFCQTRVHCRRFSPEDARKLSLFVMTDGVSDPWFETDTGLEDKAKWDHFVEKVLKGTGENEAGVCLGDPATRNAERLLEWLSFRIPGNHDDRTILALLPLCGEDARRTTEGEAGNACGA